MQFVWDPEPGQENRDGAAEKPMEPLGDKWQSGLFGSSLLTKGGRKQTEDVLLGKRIVCLYFSAHWCRACRKFTMLLSDKYDAMEAAGGEVIFLSSDKNQAGFDEYYGQMPWAAVHYDRMRDLMRDSLARRYGVRGILPALVLLD